MAEAPPPAAGNHARRALTKKALSLSVDSKKFLLVDCARLNAFRNEFKNCRIFLLGVPPPPFGRVWWGQVPAEFYAHVCTRKRRRVTRRETKEKGTTRKTDEMVKVARERGETIMPRYYVLLLPRYIYPQASESIYPIPLRIKSERRRGVSDRNRAI